LLVEVSDSSLHYDRDIKVPLYARYGVAEVWIVDVQHDCLLAFRDLASGQYRTATSTPRPGLTALTSLPDVSIDLGKLFDA
jgi:Uma2 family endonuclease